MSFLSPAVTAWLAEHHGVLADAALPKLGLTCYQRRHLVRRGVLVRVLSGAYRFTGSPDTALQRCAALCAARPGFIVAAETAAWIWGMPGFADEPDDICALAPFGGRAGAPWLRLYRTDTVHPEDVVVRPDGIVVTSPPRTIVDLTRSLGDDALAQLVEWALARRICTVDTMRRVARRLQAAGRPWVRRFVQVLDARLPGGARESGWEQRVMTALHQRGVSDLTSQVHQRLPRFGAARFDLAIPAIRWVLEVDVHPSHRTAAGASSDNRRDRSGRRIGWQTERVGEAELVDAFEATMDDLVESIEQRRADVARLIVAGMWEV